MIFLTSYFKRNYFNHKMCYFISWTKRNNLPIHSFFHSHSQIPSDQEGVWSLKGQLSVAPRQLVITFGHNQTNAFRLCQAQSQCVKSLIPNETEKQPLPAFFKTQTLGTCVSQWHIMKWTAWKPAYKAIANSLSPILLIISANIGSMFNLQLCGKFYQWVRSPKCI